MNITLNGYPVVAGDEVYDILHGTGKVRGFTQDGRVEVFFPAINKAVIVKASGHRSNFSKPTVFWSDPVLLNPVKNDARFALFRSMVSALHDAYYGVGA